MGWRWIGWWSVIISGITIVVVYFTLEETLFERAAYTAEVTDGVHKISPSAKRPDAETAFGDDKTVLEQTGSDDNRDSTGNAPHEPFSDEKPKTYWENIRLITPAPNLIGTGFKQYFRRLFHTLRVFTFPAVIYSGIQWGAQDAWLTFYLTLEESNWFGPPWNYTDAQDGVMNVPCLIGAVIGCFYGGWLSDKFVFWMAKRNNGVREAEHRLWLMFPTAIISPAGMLLFGIGTAYGWNWPVPYVGLGLIGFGWGCAGDLSMAYLMDAYPEMVLEGMVGVSVINNTIGCIFTFTASPWLAASGVRNTFIAIAVIDFVFVMLTLPMMIWGKNCRYWTKSRYLDFVRIRDSL